ncbi:NINE protein [Alteromonadaceae bacterium M269]|nr:NINE protein [Alteromonadaceae bacterium M269]
MSTPYQAPESVLQEHGMTQCSACHQDVHVTASMCPHCGVSRRSSRYKNKTIAALFAFFLGGFGAHRFYLGQWWGIFYLLLFWTSIPAIIALVEFIYFLVKDQYKWDAHYNESMPAGPGDKSGGALTVILAIVGVIVFVAFIGILAAIALPAYQQYTLKARVAGAYNETVVLQTEMENYFQQNGIFPQSNADLRQKSPLFLSDTHTAKVVPGGIEIDFGPSVQQLSSKTLVISPLVVGENIIWKCTDGTLEKTLYPPACSD